MAATLAHEIRTDRGHPLRDSALKGRAVKDGDKMLCDSMIHEDRPRHGADHESSDFVNPA